MSNLHLARRLLATTTLALALTPAFAQTFSVDFEHRADGSLVSLASGTDLWNADARAYLQGFGITVGGLSHPELSLRIGNHANVVPGSGSNTFFGSAGGGTPPAATTLSYRLSFDRPVEQLSFARAGLQTSTSSKAWDLLAFDAAGHELGRVGETSDANSGWDGKDWSLRSFMLPYTGIAWLEVRSNYGGNGASTYLSPPLDDLRFTLTPVPEPSNCALMALGLAAAGWCLGAKRRVQNRTGV